MIVTAEVDISFPAAAAHMDLEAATSNGLESLNSRLEPTGKLLTVKSLKFHVYGISFIKMYRSFVLLIFVHFA